MSMFITDLKEEDIKQCLTIYNYYILNTCYTLEEKELSLEEFTTRCLKIKERFPFIVCKEDDKVLGYAYLNEFSSRSAYSISVDLSIYTDHLLLHKHIGSSLLAEIEKRALDYNFKNIISIITSENPNSCEFHKLHGYTLEATLKDIAFKFNKVISTYYYKKVIR